MRVRGRRAGIWNFFHRHSHGQQIKGQERKGAKQNRLQAICKGYVQNPAGLVHFFASQMFAIVLQKSTRVLRSGADNNKSMNRFPVLIALTSIFSIGSILILSRKTEVSYSNRRRTTKNMSRTMFDNSQTFNLLGQLIYIVVLFDIDTVSLRVYVRYIKHL